MFKQKQMIQKTAAKKPAMILYSEIVYGFDLFVIAFGTALMTKSGWGNSAGTSFAYILNSLYPAFSFGVWSYLFQGFITLLMMVIIKKVKIEYLLSFVSSMLIGYCLDFSMWLLRFWNPEGLFLSGASYFIGFSILGAGVTLLMRSGMPVVAYDLFVRELMYYRHFSLKMVKTAFDGSLFTIDILICIIFFQKIIGIGVGTIISTAAMGLYMNHINALVDRHFSFVPLWRDRGRSAAIKEEIKEIGETKTE